jgi:hypothetical protein
MSEPRQDQLVEAAWREYRDCMSADLNAEALGLFRLTFFAGAQWMFKTLGLVYDPNATDPLLADLRAELAVFSAEVVALVKERSHER